MLFHFAAGGLTTPARAARLRCLERHVRQASDGQYKIQDYLEWIASEGLSVPSRQTLHDDCAFYAAFCDDVEYGNGDKWLRINPTVDRDAIRWFMGTGWETLSVRPRLSSAVARALLMAQQERREIQLVYAKLEQLGQGISQAETWRVIPHHVIPGLDSAYMGMWLHSGRLATFNLARIIGRVSQTGQGIEHYAPIREQPVQDYQLHCADVSLLTQLRTQYRGLEARSPHQLQTTTDPPTQHFLEEMLQGWTWRITQRRGGYPPASLIWTALHSKEDDS